MLPPGHIAAGFLATDLFLKLNQPDLGPSQLRQMMAIGAMFAFAPDLDTFWSFFKERAFIIKDVVRHNHRKFFTHAPLLWLVAGLLVYSFAQSTFGKTLGLVIWVGSWSHFLIDSIEHGIMWLWPFSTKVFALKDQGKLSENNENSFFRYWWKNVRLYSSSISFYVEILLITASIFIIFKHLI
jgi:membrane-bound metal-dependent hydrolase YbcI (DUF457 family)